MRLFTTLSLLLFVSAVYLPLVSAQDYQTWGLPDGATKRLGKGRINDIVYSPDGTRLAVASGIGVWVYDADTGEELHLLLTGNSLFGERPETVAFSPDGKTIASGIVGEIHLWDTNTGEHLQTITTHTSPDYRTHRATSIVFSPDGKTIASAKSIGDRDHIIHLWDVETGAQLRTFEHPYYSVYGIVFSPDGKTIASLEAVDDDIHLWDTNTGEHLQTFAAKRGSNSNISFSPDGNTLAIGNTRSGILMWDVAKGRHLRTITEPGYGRYDQVAFSPDGKILASVVSQGTRTLDIYLWDANTGEHLRTLTGYPEGVEEFRGTRIAFSPDGSLMCFTFSHDRTIYLWEVNTDSPFRTITAHTSFSSPMFISDGNLLTLGTGRGSISLWNVNTGEHLRILTEYSNKESHMLFGAFSPDGSLLAGTDNSYRTLSLWDANTGELLRTLTGHTDERLGIVGFSPNGNTLASGGFDGSIYLWDANTGELLRTLTGHTTFAASMTFSPDGNTLASGGFRDPDIRVWDANTGEHLRTLTGHTKGGVHSMVFSSDGSLLVSGGHDATLRVWDANTGEHLRTLTGHTYSPFSGGVESLAFSPDGNTLASAGGTERTIRLWDVETGAQLRTLEGHDYIFESVAFSPDGKTIASEGEGIVLLWEITPTSPHSGENAADVNGNGEVNIQDLVAVANALGQTGENDADVNGDGEVNIQDLVAVAAAIGEAAAAPAAIHQQAPENLTLENVQQWLTQARQANLTDAISQRGIRFLEQLLSALTPKETALLHNYPNPFNPETWIPYQLAAPADVNISIYAANGTLVRTLDLGYQPVGTYQNRSRAAHWDGRNQVGESVASGVYFYTLTAGDFTATRKMLILK